MVSWFLSCRCTQVLPMHLINNGDIMRQFVYDAWNSVMDMERNPLRHIPDLQVRHMILQILAWMWATTFALWMGSIYAFGISCMGY